MREAGFYICEEDDIFEELSALYEEIQPSPYAGSPGLDPNMPWDEEDYLDLLPEEALSEEFTDGYGIDEVDVHRGDIVYAWVFQDGPNRNLKHAYRPFLVIHANANMAYGFQITSGFPFEFKDYLVAISDYQESGLVKPSYFNLNYVRGVPLAGVKVRFGRMTPKQQREVLNKLREIKENKDGLYTNCPYLDRLDMTITNVERILC